MDNSFDGLIKQEEINMKESSNQGVDDVYDTAKKLSLEEQAKLIKRLLGDPKGTTVSFGNSSVTADTVYQINLMTPEDMALVLEAIADNIRKTASDQPEEEF